MNTRMQIPAKPTAPHLAASVGLLQRKCACGGSAGSGADCAECKKKKLQRRSAGVGPETAPPIVHDVLRSPGQPLDAQTRAFFEPRFGHDFSRVRVHTDERASQSARAVNASAYAVGRNLVFASGEYAPYSATGKSLLAHELTHVVQQQHGVPPSGDLRISKPFEPSEQEAARSAERIFQKDVAPTTARQAEVARQDAGGGDAGGVPDAGGGGDAGGGAAPPAAGGGVAPPAAGGGAPAAAPRVLRVEVENSSAAFTYPVPSILGAAGNHHFVTIAGTRPDVVVRAVLDPAIPEADPQAAALTWESDPAGGVAPGAGSLHGTLSLPTARKSVVRARLGASSAQMILWGVFVNVTPDAAPTAPAPGVHAGGALNLNTNINLTGRIFPASIITDADRPDLTGANTVAPTGTNSCGNALAGGMNSKWDMSRQIRLRNIDPAGLLPAIGGANACLDAVGGAFPAAQEVGNDDAGTGDENNNPYAGGGVITSTDTPGRRYPDAIGTDGDTVEQHLQFREFARLELHGTIWKVSNFSPWRFHVRVRRAAGQWRDNGSSSATDNAGF